MSLFHCEQTTVDKMLRYLLTLAIALTTIAVTCDAQYRKRKQAPKILQGLYANAKVGGTMFCGDVEDSGRFGFTGGVAAIKQVIRPLNARVDLDFGKLGGKADWGEEFKTIYFDLSGGVNFTFLNLIFGYDARRTVDPYVCAGMGAMFFKPENNFIANKGAEDPRIGDPNEMTISALTYGGVGALWTIKGKWGINFEFCGRLPLGNSDLLDGHDSSNGTAQKSGIFKPSNIKDELNEAINGEQNYDGVYLGSNKFDAFYTFTVGCTYKFADMTWPTSSKYNRKNYLRNKKVYDRNAKRTRRR